jgi:HEAT repeat protein
MTADLTRLIAELDQNDAALRAQAAEELCRLGESAAPAMTALAAACGDSSEEVRQWASAALEEMGAPDKAQIADLALLLQQEHADVAYWAATLLGRAGSAAAAVVGTLSATLRGHAAPAVRQRTAWALGKIGPGAAPALDALNAAAASDDPRLARLAKQALEQIGG